MYTVGILCVGLLAILFVSFFFCRSAKETQRLIRETDAMIEATMELIRETDAMIEAMKNVNNSTRELLDAPELKLVSRISIEDKHSD